MDTITKTHFRFSGCSFDCMFFVLFFFFGGGGEGEGGLFVSLFLSFLFLSFDLLTELILLL